LASLVKDYETYKKLRNVTFVGINTSPTATLKTMESQVKQFNLKPFANMLDAGGATAAGYGVPRSAPFWLVVIDGSGKADINTGIGFLDHMLTLFAFHGLFDLTLKAKGEKDVTAADIQTNAMVEVITPDVHIAKLSGKSAEFEIELQVERGLGFVPVEARRSEKLPIGSVALDAAFSPVLKASFTVENMRVGDRTDYNRLRIAITTDGSITPSAALHKASNILKDHFEKASQIEVKEVAEVPQQEKKPAKKKTVKKSKKS